MIDNERHAPHKLVSDMIVFIMDEAHIYEETCCLYPTFSELWKRVKKRIESELID